MGLFDLFRKKTAPTDNGWFNLGFTQSVSGVPVNQQTALQNASVLACVSILASDIAKLPLLIYRKRKDGNKVLAKDHYLYKLFQNPNDYQTRFEFVEHLVVNLVLNGNAYAVILRDRGIPTAIVPINASQVSVYESQDGAYFYNVSPNGLHESALIRKVTNVSGFMIPSDEVLAIRWMSYINGLWGTNHVALAKEAIGLSSALEESGSRLMGSGARPSGILTTDAKLTPEAIQNIVASWQQNHGGVRQSGGTAVLQQGLKWQALAFSSVDSQFIETRRYQVEEIARFFRVPLYKLAITEDQPGSSILELEQDYTNGTLSSYCDRIVARLYKTFEIDEDEYSIEFDFEHALKADIKTRVNNLRVGILAGLYSLNEARASLGMPSVGPDGDVLLVPTNMMALGSQPPANSGNSGPGSDVTGRPGAGGDGDAPHPNPDDLDDTAPSS